MKATFCHLTILSTLPSAGVGALLMLMLFGYQLTVIALIGIILLIGIVKKNGIMMVDFAITAERRDGLPPLEAIRRACLLRFRPILMTTMAAMLSGLPLMLANGAGSELRKPLGFAMVGGLALSQVLTLYTTPVIYLYLDRLQHWLSGAPVKSRLPALAEKMAATADASEKSPCQPHRPRPVDKSFCAAFFKKRPLLSSPSLLIERIAQFHGDGDGRLRDRGRQSRYGRIFQHG